MRDQIAHLMGIDIGTTGTKVAVYTDRGQIVRRAYRSYELQYSDDRVEIDPEIWWRAVVDCLHEILSDGLLEPSSIECLGVSSTNALIVLDGNARPLTGAIMQLDQRASGLVRTIETDLGSEMVGAVTGNRIVSGAFWGPTLLWLRLNLPEVFQSASYFFCPHSYIVFKLTNEYTIDHSRAATTMLYDIKGHEWNESMCTYFGVDKRLLPTIFKSDTIVGNVSERAGRETGLAENTQVICGCMDSLASQIGLGSSQNNVDALVIGTVGRFCVETPKYDLRFLTTNSLDLKSFFTTSPINAAGMSYRWLKSILVPQRSGDAAGMGGPTDEYEEMDKCASESPVGANGIIYHPYLTGERSPIWNPNAKGSYIGLAVRHTRNDIIRATLEGTGYALYQNMLIIENDLDHRVHTLHAGGGGSRSSLWMQIISDVLGKEISVPKEEDVETLGIAILAGEAIGRYENVGTGIAQCVRIARTFTPDKSAHWSYMQYFDLYARFYEVNKGFYDRLAKTQRALR